MRKSVLFLIAAVLIAIIATAQGCDRLAVIPVEASASMPQTAMPGTPQPSLSPATPEPTSTATPTPAPTATPEPTATSTPAPEQMNLLFTGDIMFYDSAIKQQWDTASNKYDFTSFFENVEPEIQGADFAVGNLETPIWDLSKSKTNNFRFAAPAEAVTYLKSAGFDVLTTANNHAMDQGLPALANTIQVIKDNGLMTAGTYRNAAEQDAFCMLEKNGVKVALFADTEFMNIPQANKLGMGVDMIDRKRMTGDVARARSAGADAVVFSLHFGKQYSLTASTFQRSIVQALKAAGATAVIGAHPHVLEPLVVDPSGQFVAAYSLGNITTKLATRDMQFAAMLKLTIHKDSDTGKVTVANVSYVPTWVRIFAAPGEQPKTCVFDLRQALADCQSGTNPLIPAKYLNELKKGMALEQKILGVQYMERLN